MRAGSAVLSYANSRGELNITYEYHPWCSNRCPADRVRCWQFRGGITAERAWRKLNAEKFNRENASGGGLTAERAWRKLTAEIFNLPELDIIVLIPWSVVQTDRPMDIAKM